MDKEILCTVKSILDEDESYVIYSDNTYRCPSWKEGDYSEWRILGGKYFDVKHSGKKWCMTDHPIDLSHYEPDEETSLIIEQIELALAVKRMVEE